MQKGFLLPAFPNEHIKGLALGLLHREVEMTEKMAEVVCASRRGAGDISEKGGGGGYDVDREVVLIGGAGYNGALQASAMNPGRRRVLP